MATGCICNRLVGSGITVSPACIGQLWVFEDLVPGDLAAIAEAALRKTYDEGRQVFAQGDPAAMMFLIKAGRVKLTKLLEDGTEITLDIRKAGDFMGENMLSEDMDYPVTAWCMEQTLVCGFSKERFEKLVLEHPSIGLQVIRNLSKRIASLTERVGSMSLSNLADRLREVLVNVAREHGTPVPNGTVIPFPLTHEDLSFLVGAHRVSITRAMKDLRESGAITQVGRQLVVMDLI